MNMSMVTNYTKTVMGQLNISVANENLSSMRRNGMHPLFKSITFKTKQNKKIIVSSILSDKLILQLRFMDINDTEQEALNLVM